MSLLNLALSDRPQSHQCANTVKANLVILALKKKIKSLNEKQNILITMLFPTTTPNLMK